MAWKSSRVKQLTCLTLIFILAASSFVPEAMACGHDGFYVGGGYEQLFMVTPEHQLGTGSTPRISFGPGFGANLVGGYDFCGSRWGIQVPLEFAALKLNHAEWVYNLAASVEGVLHLREWKNGLDFHLVGGIGWTYLTEGSINDRTRNNGITASIGPGLSYFFARKASWSGAVTAELPLRYAYYFGNHLSSNGTSVFAFPLRLSVQFGF